MTDPVLFDAILAERAAVAARLDATAWQHHTPAPGLRHTLAALLVALAARLAPAMVAPAPLGMKSQRLPQ
ncbi:MAG TPA: hypothetical protein VIL85_10905 [Thermomicrobiales bacterium]|jgi:hypothetical protein